MVWELSESVFWVANLAINRKKDYYFWRCSVSLVMFSYWSKFLHVNNMTSSGVMTIFAYKGLTRNPEIRNTPVWVLTNIWGLGQVKESKFVKNICKITECCKMPGLQLLLPFLSYWGKTTGMGKGGGWGITHKPDIWVKAGGHEISWWTKVIEFKN